jgi:ArsR family transcriptional regulator
MCDERFDSPSEKSSDELRSRRFKILSDQNRLSVLEALLEGPRSVMELRRTLGTEPTLLSHHLRVLREEGLVEAQRSGKSMVYSLAQEVGIPSQKALELGCCRITLR